MTTQGQLFLSHTELQAVINKDTFVGVLPCYFDCVICEYCGGQTLDGYKYNYTCQNCNGDLTDGWRLMGIDAGKEIYARPHKPPKYEGEYYR